MGCFLVKLICWLCNVFRLIPMAWEYKRVTSEKRINDEEFAYLPPYLLWVVVYRVLHLFRNATLRCIFTNPCKGFGSVWSSRWICDICLVSCKSLHRNTFRIDLFDSKQLGRAVGTFQGIEFIGSLIGAPIGALLAVVTGYYFVFYITFGLISVSCFLAFLSKELRTIGKATGIALTSTPSLGDSLKSLIQWELIVICVISFTRMFVMNGVMSTVFPLYLHETLGFDVSIIGIITVARTGGFTTATILSGYMSDRIGRKKNDFAGPRHRSVLHLWLYSCRFLGLHHSSWYYWWIGSRTRISNAYSSALVHR